MNTNNIIKSAMLIALFFIASNIIPPINITGVPFTFQTLIIFLVPFILDFKTVILWYLSLLLICLIGLPIMSGFQGGLGVLLGPTAGFIYGWFVELVFISTILLFTKNRLYIFLVMFIGTVISLSIGALWLSSFNNVAYIDNIKIILVTFLPFSVVKMIITLTIVKRLPSSILQGGIDFEL